jgi:hypothetical protein
MKKIDLSTQAGLDLLKEKAKSYGHYAEQLQVLELIEEIEFLRSNPDDPFNEKSKKLGW